MLSAIAIAVLVISAEDSVPGQFAQWTPASLQQYEQKLRDAAADPHRFVVQQVADFPRDSALLVRRQADGAPEWHETQADVFFVLSGSATPIVGGTLLNGEMVSPHEERNDSGWCAEEAVRWAT
jgi:hypothetical protein